MQQHSSANMNIILSKCDVTFLLKFPPTVMTKFSTVRTKSQVLSYNYSQYRNRMAKTSVAVGIEVPGNFKREKLF